MHLAYWNEPSPLKRSYPGRTSSCETNLMVVGFFLALIAFTGILPGAKDFPGPFWAFLLILAIPSVLSALAFWSAPRVGALCRSSAWKKAFIANNVDLGLRYHAVKKVIRLLRATTTYHDVTFESVATHLACSLRKEDPFASGEHTTFSWEVLHAYHHFAFGDRAIQPTYCPQ